MIESKHDLEIDMTAGGGMCVRIERDTFGQVTLLGFVTVKNILLFSKPKLHITQSVGTMSSFVLTCLAANDQCKEINLSLHGEEKALVTATQYIVYEMLDRACHLMSNKSAAVTKDKTFVFRDGSKRNSLDFSDSKLNRMFNKSLGTN